MVKLLFFRFGVTNSRLKNKKNSFRVTKSMSALSLSLSSYKREVDKWKNFLKYDSFNPGEPLQIDTTPQISKNLL